MLLLVHVQVDSLDRGKVLKKKHDRQTSDDLMKDLEELLGSLMVDYMQICVKYCHSSFPHVRDLNDLKGLSCFQRMAETTTIAALRYGNRNSAWSLPIPAPTSLFHLIEQYWGDERARETIRQMLGKPTSPISQMTQRRTELDTVCTNQRMPAMLQAAPMVPQRQASLQKSTISQDEETITECSKHGRQTLETGTETVKRPISLVVGLPSRCQDDDGKPVQATGKENAARWSWGAWF